MQEPGKEHLMHPEPVFDDPKYKGSGKLKGKVAIITGGDSGIGRAISVLFAKEGADVVIVYLNEHDDAKKTKEIVSSYGQRALLIPGDLSEEEFCIDVVKKTISEFNVLDILINNAGGQHTETSIEDIPSNEFEKIFRTNFFSMFYLTKAALSHLSSGGAVINTTSVTAYRGSGHLIDYSATKGAIVSFTRSLAKSLGKKGIRVNAVAPGPIWTPLIASSFSRDQQKSFGKQTVLGRPGQPVEVAPSFLFLASHDASYMTGQVLHPNGGEIIGG